MTDEKQVCSTRRGKKSPSFSHEELPLLSHKKLLTYSVNIGTLVL